LTAALLCTILTDIIIYPEVLDVSMPPHTGFFHSAILGYTAFRMSRQAGAILP
jgi:hypothetical protein